jgi:ABC-type transporter Mla MlaB component
MLRITSSNESELLTLTLEGKLAGPWVKELADCWRDLSRDRECSAVCIDLSAVTFIDAAGKSLLTAMHQHGAELVASGCLMKAIVAEIKEQKAEIRDQKAGEIAPTSDL